MVQEGYRTDIVFLLHHRHRHRHHQHNYIVYFHYHGGGDQDLLPIVLTSLFWHYLPIHIYDVTLVVDLIPPHKSPILYTTRVIRMKDNKKVTINISNTRDSVSSDFQTLRRQLSIFDEK